MSEIDEGVSPPGANDAPLSVSEIAGAVKRTLETRFAYVRVRGEISGWRGPHSSGHGYFALKDDRARLDAVVWKGVLSALRFRPEEGMEVIATGKISSFPGRSNYQLIIERLEPAGVGALMQMLEARKRALAAEGLFDAARKRPLPFLPQVIGVVTSPTGAVIRDILHRLADRFPRRVLVWPVAVQGEKCAAEVAAAIRGFNALPVGGSIPRPDLLIVARGGGSLEDLWGFNEEVVVRAAADSQIPLISAVGHETDTTLIDYAADRRAPTPTAAAEMAVPVRAELLATLADLVARRERALRLGIERRRQRLTDLSRALPRPEALLAERRQRFDHAAERLPMALRALVHQRRAALAARAGRLSPAVLRERAVRGAERLTQVEARLVPALRRLVALQQMRLAASVNRLSHRPLTEALRRNRHELTRSGAQLLMVMRQLRLGWQQRLAASSRLLETLSYRATLARGYVVVRDDKGSPLTEVTRLRKGQALALEFADDRRIGAVVTEVDGPPAPKAGTAPPRARSGGGQGSLF